MKQFHSFRLDTNDECLWREGQRLALTRKAFAVLNYLVERAGHLVTKEELIEAVWPETFVQEEILKTYVRKLRLGLVAAFRPVSIIAVIAVLFSARARVNGPVFLLGWMAGLSLVGSLLLGFGSFGGASADLKPSLVVEIIKLAVGGLAIWFAIHKWRTRPRRGEEPPMPGWIAGVDALTAARTFLVAVALAAPINPKCLLAVIAAVAVIGNSDLNFTQSWFALAVFVVCASLSIIIAVLSYFIAGQKAERSLTVVRDWLIRNDAVTMTIVFGIGARSSSLWGLSVPCRSLLLAALAYNDGPTQANLLI